MSGIAKLLHTREFEQAFDEDSDDVMALFESKDYEQTGFEFVTEDADMSQLEEITEEFGYWDDVLAEVCLACGLQGDPDEDEDLDNTERAARIESNSSAFTKLRAAVAKLVDAEAKGWQWVCDTYGLDPDRLEVYEHWIVTSWLARQLASAGEVTGEFAGLTIWGRCTTGQAICLDRVVQDIACELWADEFKGETA